MNNSFKTKKHIKVYQLFELFIDLLIIIISFQFVHIINSFINNGDLFYSFKLFIDQFKITADMLSNNNSYFITFVITNIIFVIVVLINMKIYETSVLTKKYTSAMFSLAISLASTNIIIFILNSFTDISLIDILPTFATFITQLTLLAFWKFIYSKLFGNSFKEFVIIIGPKESAFNLSKKFLIDKSTNEYLRYILVEEEFDVKVLNDSIKFCHTIYLTDDASENIKNRVFSMALKDSMLKVKLVPKLYELGMINSEIYTVDDKLGLRVKSLHLSLFQRFIKRTFDLVVSVFAIIFLLPFMFIFALLIKIQDGGSIFYKQERVTRGNKKFMLIKFRTMIENAEKKTGAIISTKNDSRITKLGKFMRATRVDELPQLINIIKGEISIVGPRPERQVFIDQFVKDNHRFKYRENVKAGVTGLAQSLGKYDTSFTDKLRYDLLYIRKASFLFDLKILLLTVRTVFDRSATTIVDDNMTLEEFVKKQNARFYKSENKYRIDYI